MFAVCAQWSGWVVDNAAEARGVAGLGRGVSAGGLGENVRLSFLTEGLAGLLLQVEATGTCPLGGANCGLGSR